MIVAGKRFEFILFMLTLAFIYIGIWLARKGTTLQIKRISCVDALEEAVGRASEMGTPVWYGTGNAGLDGQYATMNIAALSILGRVAELCGKYGVYLQYMCNIPHMLPISRDLIKEGYTKGGRPEMYEDNMSIYVGASQSALVAATQGYLLEQKPSVVMIFGATMYEMLNTLAFGSRVGAMMLAGTPRLYYQSATLLAADYQLIGEELYAAGAMVSGNPIEVGSIQGEDWSKLVVLLLLIIFAIVVLLLLIIFAIAANLANPLYQVLTSW